MEILSKDMLSQWILPHLILGKRGFSIRVAVEPIVQLILCRLKTGCQWRQLPIRQFLANDELTWQGIYYHRRATPFNRWAKLGCWKKIWINLLAAHHAYLDLSCAQVDRSAPAPGHTLAKNGGEAIGYQGRKAANTTNSLFLADNQGIMLSIATPQEGQHHDLYQIQQLFEQLCQLLLEAGIDLKGVFLNADPGFDSQSFRQICEQKQIQANIKSHPRNATEETLDFQYRRATPFDEELYQRRVVIERANVWVDSFKALFIRFETLVITWVNLHFLAFVVLFLRKISKKKKA